MYVVCFSGEYWFPEPDPYWRFDRPDVPCVYPGRMYDWDGTPLWLRFDKTVGASRHMSNVFNIYVIM